jgi:hypothetical protein
MESWRQEMGGQKIFLWPSLDLVVVMTGGNYNTPSPANTLAIKYILPPLDARPPASPF